MEHNIFAGKLFLLGGLILFSTAFAGTGELTLIHSGDIHGHLVPRHNVRSDNTDRMEGGLARMATVINHIRKANPGKTLYFNTGDTLQGSAEALFTRGQALFEVMNLLKPDFDEPGNWDYLYGTERFLETFVGSPVKPPLFHTQAVAANLYYACPGVATPPSALTKFLTNPAYQTALHLVSIKKQSVYLVISTFHQLMPQRPILKLQASVPYHLIS